MSISSQVKWRGSLTIALVMALLMSNVAFAAKPVSMQAPVNGEIVSGIYVVAGTGSGAAVEVSIDNGSWLPATGGKSWTYNWDTTAYSNGSHVVSARYVGSATKVSATVTVNNVIGPRQPVAGEVLINEFVAANSITQTSEWVEILSGLEEGQTVIAP